MGKYRRLTHVVYKCDYHIVFTPKYRFRILTGHISSMLEHDIQTICQWKDVVLEELNIQTDHVHMIRRYVKYQEEEERKAEQDRSDYTLF